MIGQYLSNTNGNATIPILQKNLELNKALVYWIEWEKIFSMYYLASLLIHFWIRHCASAVWIGINTNPKFRLHLRHVQWSSSGLCGLLASALYHAWQREIGWHKGALQPGGTIAGVPNSSTSCLLLPRHSQKNSTLLIKYIVFDWPNTPAVRLFKFKCSFFN